MLLRSRRHPDGSVRVSCRAGAILGLLSFVLLLPPQRAEATLLSDLFAGSTLSAGSLTFDSWTLITNDADFDVLDPTLIDVTASVMGNVITLSYATVVAPGAGTWLVDPLNLFMETVFSYRVRHSALNPFITDAGLSIVGGFDFGDGPEDAQLLVEEDIAESGDTLMAEVDPAFMVDMQSDAAFLGSFSSLDVTTTVLLDYFESPGEDPVVLSSFTQTFAVPEPTSLGMGAVALLGFGLARRRERRARRQPASDDQAA